MSNLNERIAALREAVEKMTPGEWRIGIKWDDTVQIDAGEEPRLEYTGWQGVVECSGCTEQRKKGYKVAAANAAGIVALRNNALAIIDEQAAEIGRLHTRIAELERAAMSIPDNDVGWDAGPGEGYVEADAGPTPLRGRVTRRD